MQQDNQNSKFPSVKNILCPFCNSVNDSDYSFCGVCGKKNIYPLNENILFLNELEAYYESDLDELKKIISYQKYFFETSEKGLALIDIDKGQFIKVNQSFLEFTGSSLEDLKNETFTSFINNLNYKNKRNNIINFGENLRFSILNRNFKKFLVEVKRNPDVFADNSLLIVMDKPKLPELRKIKKDDIETKKLFLISKIAEDINRSLDINIILSNTLERVVEATASDAAWIMFIDENQRLHLVSSRGISQDLMEELKSRAIEADKGSRGEALFLGKTVEANMKVSEDTMTGLLAKRENLESMVTVPLKSEKDVIGVMSLGRRKNKDYAKKELKLLDAIGNHVVIAIKNARLYNQVKKQLRELNLKNKKLHELEKMKEKLTGMIVHDLKSPLTSIMAYAEHIQSDKTIKNEKLIRFMQMIYSSSQDIMQMVMNLLDISRMEKGKLKLNFSYFKPDIILNDVLDKFKIKVLKKDIEIIKNIPEGLPQIKADKNLLDRVIMNLMDNAIKYSNSGRKVETGIILPEDSREIIFSIVDEGKGIGEEYRNRVFDLFFTLDHKDIEITTSTGIGLSFCKLVIEAHNGRIWVEDNKPQGSRFYFAIPLK